MLKDKNWHQSLTVWGTLVAVAVSIYNEPSSIPNILNSLGAGGIVLGIRRKLGDK